MRSGEEDWPSGAEDEQWIDPDQLTLQDELGRGAFGVGKFYFVTLTWFIILVL